MSDYCGRFAPSPSGGLHFGSLVTAVASYCDAKSQQGSWFLRIEDLDSPRVKKGADKAIIQALTDLGFIWDGKIRYQSEHITDYNAALQQLQQLSYPCDCGRQLIRNYNAQYGLALTRYPGFCKDKNIDTQRQHSWRLKVNNKALQFKDAIYGIQTEDLTHTCGDFIIKRADGIYSYQLAVVIDDAVQNITDIVRGQDLLDSSNRQRYLQTCLAYPSLNYAHIPLVMDKKGYKLSKQNHAPHLDLSQPVLNIWQALDFLQQNPPHYLLKQDLKTLWHWAWQYWHLKQIKIPR